MANKMNERWVSNTHHALYEATKKERKTNESCIMWLTFSYTDTEEARCFGSMRSYAIQCKVKTIIMYGSNFFLSFSQFFFHIPFYILLFSHSSFVGTCFSHHFHEQYTKIRKHTHMHAQMFANILHMAHFFSNWFARSFSFFWLFPSFFLVRFVLIQSWKSVHLIGQPR